MLGIVGTRMLSESELIPVMAISKASKRHRAGRASLLVVSFIVGSSNGRPSGFSFARAGGWRAGARGGGGARGRRRQRGGGTGAAPAGAAGGGRRAPPPPPPPGVEHICHDQPAID